MSTVTGSVPYTSGVGTFTPFTYNWHHAITAPKYSPTRFLGLRNRTDALDFDDLILHTVRLLQNEAEVRDYYRHKFRYILIDEYQDTNRMQYELVRLLVDGHRNICVVGDDDQSIYRFRGADISNILSFEKEYRGARTIRLEQNYRSTRNILNAANQVIANNTERKAKTLWTENEEGSKVHFRQFLNAYELSLIHI